MVGTSQREREREGERERGGGWGGGANRFMVIGLFRTPLFSEGSSVCWPLTAS